jgi:hypothetical protein
MTSAWLAGLAVAAAVATLGCAPDVPANPTYTSHIAAILDAHCVRCHGANDMLNVVPLSVKAPVQCYLQRYEDAGDCSAAATCLPGAGAPLCSGLAASYISYPDDHPKRMPPLPSEPLNDWEKDVITRWNENHAPK